MSALTDWLASAIGRLLTGRGITLRMATAYNFLAGLGYSEEGACAIVGNLCQESGTNLVSVFRPAAVLDHGSQGIAQWRLSRLTDLIGFAKTHGLNVEYLSTQIRFLDYELKSDYAALYDTLVNGGSSVGELTTAFMLQYERPAPATAGLANRQKHAQAVYDYIQTLPKEG